MVMSKICIRSNNIFNISANPGSSTPDFEEAVMSARIRGCGFLRHEGKVYDVEHPLVMSPVHSGNAIVFSPETGWKKGIQYCDTTSVRPVPLEHHLRAA